MNQNENIEDHVVLKSEPIKINRDKVARPDKIVVETISALGDLGIDKITEIVNEVYDSIEIPEELIKTIFTMIPKMSDINECELHRTISL